MSVKSKVYEGVAIAGLAASAYMGVTTVHTYQSEQALDAEMKAGAAALGISSEGYSDHYLLDSGSEYEIGGLDPLVILGSMATAGAFGAGASFHLIARRQRRNDGIEAELAQLRVERGI